MDVGCAALQRPSMNFVELPDRRSFIGKPVGQRKTLPDCFARCRHGMNVHSSYEAKAVDELCVGAVRDGDRQMIIVSGDRQDVVSQGEASRDARERLRFRRQLGKIGK